MIKVFSGKWRGLGDTDAGLGMILDFHFREILHHFKGADLSVFLAIALHSDENGLSFPGYTLLMQETGYSRDTIAQALGRLCDLQIGGRRVLMRAQQRGGDGSFDNNLYRIFPTEAEIEDDALDRLFGSRQSIPSMASKSEKPDTVKPETGNTDTGKSDLKLNQLDNRNQQQEVVYANAFVAYENEIGLLTPMISQDLGDLIDEFGDILVQKAIKIAAENNKRFLRYVEGVLKNWARNGFRDDRSKTTEGGQKNGSQGSQASQGPDPETVRAEILSLREENHVN